MPKSQCTERPDNFLANPLRHQLFNFRAPNLNTRQAVVKPLPCIG